MTFKFSGSAASVREPSNPPTLCLLPVDSICPDITLYSQHHVPFEDDMEMCSNQLAWLAWLTEQGLNIYWPLFYAALYANCCLKHCFILVFDDKENSVESIQANWPENAHDSHHVGSVAAFICPASCLMAIKRHFIILSPFFIACLIPLYWNRVISQNVLSLCNDKK